MWNFPSTDQGPISDAASSKTTLPYLKLPQRIHPIRTKLRTKTTLNGSPEPNSSCCSGRVTLGSACTEKGGPKSKLAVYLVREAPIFLVSGWL